MKGLDRVRIALGDGLIMPADSGYDQRRRVFNGDIDRFPFAIAMCEDVGQVTLCLEAAASLGRRATVRSSGHNVAGRSIADGALLIDVSRMKGVRIDRDARICNVRAGSTWGELDRATQRFGLATTGGTVTTTGLPGLTLGGGIGWLLPSYGLTCDNLLEARLVTANGDVFTASDEKCPDVMRALRGSGHGLGIVVDLTFRLHEVPNVTGGAITYGLADARDVLGAVIPTLPHLPREIMLSPALLWTNGTLVLELDVAVTGAPAALRTLTAALEGFTPKSDTVRRRDYCDMQSILDNPFRRGVHAYWKSGFVSELDETNVKWLVHQMEESPTKQCMILIEHYHGAYDEPELETSYPHRGQRLNVLVVGAWSRGEDVVDSVGQEVRRWAQTTLLGLGSSLTGNAYVNYVGADDVSSSACALSDVESLRRELDPLGLFRSD